MELQIQDLVSSIRKEGIDAAQAEAGNIIAEAKKKAEEIIAQANAEAKSKKDSTEREISILKESAAMSAEQAKRDAVLSFKDEIKGEFEKILAAEIKNGLEIRPTKNVQAGFRLAAKDGSGYFDCSDEEIMQMLMPYFRDLNF